MEVLNYPENDFFVGDLDEWLTDGVRFSHERDELNKLFECLSLCLCLLCLLGAEDYRSRLSSECFQDLVCPERCRCEGTVVDCSNLKLTKIPPYLPEHTTDL